MKATCSQGVQGRRAPWLAPSAVGSVEADRGSIRCAPPQFQITLPELLALKVELLEQPPSTIGSR